MGHLRRFCRHAALSRVRKSVSHCLPDTRFVVCAPHIERCDRTPHLSTAHFPGAAKKTRVTCRRRNGEKKQTSLRNASAQSQSFLCKVLRPSGYCVGAVSCMLVFAPRPRDACAGTAACSAQGLHPLANCHGNRAGLGFRHFGQCERQHPVF
jgi:hypothetical protein